jgi:hypothetical protein
LLPLIVKALELFDYKLYKTSADIVQEKKKKPKAKQNITM